MLEKSWKTFPISVRSRRLLLARTFLARSPALRQRCGLESPYFRQWRQALLMACTPWPRAYLPTEFLELRPNAMITANTGEMLNESAATVRLAVKSRWGAGRQMDVHYDHPVLLLQHMIWHEGYHHGQIKLALKLAGRPVMDNEAGPITWDVWMNKTEPGTERC